MKAARIHEFGPPNVIVIDELPRSVPGQGEVLVRVKATGVGPRDALIRERKNVVDVPLPLLLGSDLLGVIEEVGPSVSRFNKGDEVYGCTNANFCGAYTEYAMASAGMVARKPQGLSDVEAASIPVVAVTAWQMLFRICAGESWTKGFDSRRSGKCGRLCGATGEPGETGSSGYRRRERHHVCAKSWCKSRLSLSIY
jgi:NADPH:quinone reductase-like Zn-dependent oxidoreductase